MGGGGSAGAMGWRRKYVEGERRLWMGGMGRREGVWLVLGWGQGVARRETVEGSRGEYERCEVRVVVGVGGGALGAGAGGEERVVCVGG